jgi:hypothetical protein
MSKQIRDPEVDPNEIQKTLWIGGHIYEIMLSRDFVALDSNSKEISKETFLKELSEGSSDSLRIR